MAPVTRSSAKYKFEIAVGSSGTIMNLANIINFRRGGNAEVRLNNFSFTKDELFEAVEEILEAKTEKQRLKILGLTPTGLI
jgi:exopolyphosphatase/pppGpp-phosphohydrolase